MSSQGELGIGLIVHSNARDQLRGCDNPTQRLAKADKQRVFGSGLGTSVARNFNFDSHQRGRMRRCGELDSIAEFHLIADYAGNHERFQILEPYLGRPFRADAQVGIRLGLTNQISISVLENVVAIAGDVLKVDLIPLM